MFCTLRLDWSRADGWVPRPHSCMAQGHRKPFCLGHIAPFMLSTLNHWHEASFCSVHQNNPGQSRLQPQSLNTIPDSQQHTCKYAESRSHHGSVHTLIGVWWMIHALGITTVKAALITRLEDNRCMCKQILIYHYNCTFKVEGSLIVLFYYNSLQTN